MCEALYISNSCTYTRGSTCARVCVVCSLALGHEGHSDSREVELICGERFSVAGREGLFLQEGEIGMSSVFSVFLTRAGVYLTVCLCLHTHTHTLHMGYSDVSPGVEMTHLDSPKHPDGLNLGIFVFLYVYKVHVCTNMSKGGMRSWANFFH